MNGANGHSSALPEYTPPPETSHDLKYATLTTIDLSEFDKPGGKEKLAAQLKNAAHDIGFFYVKNIGLTQTQINRQFAIGQSFFSLPESERLKYRAPLEEGIYNGYRPLGSIEILPGLRDNIEFYNVMKFLPQYEREHPDVYRQNWAEIEAFHRHVHEHIAYRLFKLLATILEIPEDELVDGHRYESNCDSGLRYMMYRSRTESENAQFKELYSRGHTDNGTITFVFQQPIAALQVRQNQDAEWEWLCIPEGHIAVNIADMLSIVSNGYLKSGIHRVVVPPADQACNDRLGLLYFVRPSDRLMLKTVDSPLLKRLGLLYFVRPSDRLMLKTVDSPLLKRLGLDRGEENNAIDVPAIEWTRARIRKNWSRSPTDLNAETELAGFSVKHFHD